MAVRKTKRLLDLAREIVQREQELALLRAEFERLADQENEDASPAPPLVARPLARTSSLPMRVQSLLDTTPGTLTAHDVAAQLGESLDSVRSALSKLVAKESAERVSTGVYRSSISGHRRAAGEDD